MNKTVYLIVILAITIGLLIFNLSLPKISKTVKVPTVQFSAWIPAWDEARSLSSLDSEAGKKIGEILPVWYQLDASGQVQEIKSDKKNLITQTSISKKIKITPTLVNSISTGFDPVRVTKMLTANQGKTIDLLVTTAKEKKYAGWDLDLEEIAKEDRDLYTTFVRDLSEKLHIAGLTLSVTVYAQEGDSDQWQGALGQDIEGLGKYADQVRIMAYDFHSSSSNPGPITPVIDLQKTIIYAKSKVDPAKIVIGLPTYGYDWQIGGTATSYQYQEMQTHLTDKKVKVSRDIDSNELKGSYQGHQIWFLDADSVAKLTQITKAYGITHICFWHLGGEDTNLWGKI